MPDRGRHTVVGRSEQDSFYSECCMVEENSAALDAQDCNNCYK